VSEASNVVGRGGGVGCLVMLLGSVVLSVLLTVVVNALLR